jgi:hypothetical protein
MNSIVLFAFDRILGGQPNPISSRYWGENGRIEASFGVILDNATAKGVREHGRVALLDKLQAVASRR